jgi:hypothetical protein
LRKFWEKMEKKLEKVEKFFHFIPFFKKIGILFPFFPKSTPQLVKILHKNIKMLIHCDL